MKPKIAITMGDFNGIGPEIALKCLISPAVREICVPLLVGSIDVFEFYARKLRLKITLREISSIPERNSEKSVPVFHIRKFQHPRIEPGHISAEAGGYAGEAVEVACSLCRQNILGGLVTSPVCKESMHRAGYKYPGQTEMLADLCGIRRFGMMLVSGNLRVGLATIHIPLRKVTRDINKSLLREKIDIFVKSLMSDFAAGRPKIALLGINPHAGENGAFGIEEKKIIKPVIKEILKKGIRADGPFAADGFFGTHGYERYDAVIAMYHDQGLIPLKLSGFKTGVNFTAGLPIVRTSPDHGTAFQIAGKGIADFSSMKEAIRLSVKIINNRSGK